MYNIQRGEDKNERAGCLTEGKSDQSFWAESNSLTYPTPSLPRGGYFSDCPHGSMRRHRDCKGETKERVGETHMERLDERPNQVRDQVRDQVRNPVRDHRERSCEINEGKVRVRDRPPRSHLLWVPATGSRCGGGACGSTLVSHSPPVCTQRTHVKTFHASDPNQAKTELRFSASRTHVK